MAITDDLVDWWDLDEASGSAVGEHAGITLTEVNGTIGTGTIGGRAARDFELDDNEYLETADSAALSLSADQAFTVAFRVQFETTAGGGARQILGKSDNVSNEWVVFLDGAAFLFRVWDSTGTPGGVYSTVTPATATPYTIRVWHDPTANVVGIQVDTETKQTAAWTTGTRDTAAKFLIGRANNSTTMDGLIGSVAIWKRVITDGEFDTFRNSGSGVAYADVVGGGGTRPVKMAGHWGGFAGQGGGFAA